MKHKGILLPSLWWFAALSVVGTLMHFDLIDRPYYTKQRALHHDIVTHSAPAPYQYRILQPVLVETVLNASMVEHDTDLYKFLFWGSYASIRFLAIFTTFLAVFFAIRLTWPQETAVWATTVLAVFLPFTYRYYYYEPTSVLEMAFFGLGLLATFTRTPWALLPLVAVGALNRETMCFIPFAYFLYWLPKLTKTEWAWLVISAGAWLLVFGGLRVLWPATTTLLDVPYFISSNLKLSRGTLDVLMILSPLLLIVFAAKRIPAQYLRLALCSAPWLLLHFCTTVGHEIRYYMPVLIWALPGLLTIFGERSVEQPDGSDATTRALQP